MKLFLYCFVCVVLFSCNHEKNTSSLTRANSKTVIRNEIISKVKSHKISDSLTVAQALEILAEENGHVSWQIFKPAEFINDPNIVSVIGTTINESPGVVPFKLWYLYHIDSEQISYYFGEMAGRSIPEFQIISSIYQLRLFDNILDEHEKVNNFYK